MNEKKNVSRSKSNGTTFLTDVEFWKSMIIVVIVLIGMWIGSYFVKLPFNFASAEMFLYITITLLISVFLQGVHTYTSDSNYPKVVTFVLAGVLLLWGLAYAILGITSSKFVQTEQYRSIAKVTESEFISEFEDISEEGFSNLAIVDLDTAKRVGDRVIGNINHSSWFEVDQEYNLIIYKGKQYRLSPLNYGGFFKYNKAKDAGNIPGYILVDAKTQEAIFQEVDGGIRYSPSAFFGNNLKRHLLSQYPTDLIEYSFLEIDESGIPYWVSGVSKPTIGFIGGKVIKEIIVTNATSGESKKYLLNEIPEWIDHAYSLEYLIRIGEFHNRYVNGFFNFSQNGVYKTSYQFKDDDFPGYNSFVDKNGDVCFYTGLTPANGAETNVGFWLVNARTGEYKQYNCSGAEEASAMSAAEGLVQNLGYKATFPTVINVAGEPTYVMNLKDKSGLIQRYALCNIKNYSIVVEAESLDICLNEYIKKMSKENATVDSSLIETQKLKIKQIYTAEIEGTTWFYYVFEDDNTLYKAPITLNEFQVQYSVGDLVTVAYIPTDESIRVLAEIN